MSVWYKTTEQEGPHEHQTLLKRFLIYERCFPFTSMFWFFGQSCQSSQREISQKQSPEMTQNLPLSPVSSPLKNIRQAFNTIYSVGRGWEWWKEKRMGKLKSFWPTCIVPARKCGISPKCEEESPGKIPVGGRERRMQMWFCICREDVEEGREGLQLRSHNKTTLETAKKMCDKT